LPPQVHIQQQQFASTAPVQPAHRAPRPPPTPPTRPPTDAAGTNPLHSQQRRTGSIVITTTVEKGPLGIGLDLCKSASGMGQVLKMKEFPPDVANPALLSTLAIQVGDVIVAVNGMQCPSLSETVKVIRSAEGKIQLTLERYV
jgi:hypothetical protein